MSSRFKRMVDLALQMEKHTDSGSSSEAFSSFGSDLDPTFLPSSDEELSYSSDLSDAGERAEHKNKNPKRKKRSRSEQENENFESQPCCSKSLPTLHLEGVGVPNQEATNSLSFEPENNVSEKELDEFFEVELSAKEEAENMKLEAQEEVASQSEGTWRQPVGNHQVFYYFAESGLHAGYAATLINNLSTYSCFRSIVDDKIIDEMVNQTNLYASQVMADSEDVSKESRLNRWVPTDKEEMLKFIGIVAYMGMVRMPSLEKYWSNDELFHISIIPRIMPRNRFQLLLRMWHFSNNEDCPEGDRLHKIKPLLDALVNNFQAIYTPGRKFCIDESVVPFQGRLLIKQYIPKKTYVWSEVVQTT
nr:unnamed protein product [Callosobruchus analis]